MNFQGKTEIRWILASLVGLLLTSGAGVADHPASSILPGTEHIDGVTTVDATALIELAQSTPTLHIIDARLRSDRRYGYIEGSISLPDAETDCDSLQRIVPDKRTPTAFYCNGPKCARSEHAVRIARQCGYTELFWYQGGMETWIDEDFPVFRD